MSLARAFTKRVKRSAEGTSRSGTVKHGISRNMISLPTELISTTNVQALTAPDIRTVSNSSSGSSINSGHESDFSTIDRSFLAGASTDASSIDSSPVTPLSPPMGDNRTFFDDKHLTSTSAISTTDFIPDVPVLPQRAPSHSKKAHVELSRKRSIQRMSPPPNTIEKSTTRRSADTVPGVADIAHPFGRELAQVNEVAEGFGATAAVLDEEEQEMLSKGLCKFGVDDYLNEIAGMYGGVFEGRLGPMANPWI